MNTGYTFANNCWCVDAVVYRHHGYGMVSCIICWNLRQWIDIIKFLFINQI